MKRYLEIENLAKEIYESSMENKIDLVLMLNELTVMRMLKEKDPELKKEIKRCKSTSCVIKEGNTIMKLAAIYDPETTLLDEAEEILINCDFRNQEVIVVAKNSTCLEDIK